MAKFTLVEVTNEKTENQWLSFPSRLYQKDRNYIRPLDQDVKKLFDPALNKKLRKGEAVRWLLLNERNENIGRIAAFIDPHTAKKQRPTYGRLWFF